MPDSLILCWRLASRTVMVSPSLTPTTFPMSVSAIGVIMNDMNQRAARSLVGLIGGFNSCLSTAVDALDYNS